MTQAKVRQSYVAVSPKRYYTAVYISRGENVTTQQDFPTGREQSHASRLFIWSLLSPQWLTRCVNKSRCWHDARNKMCRRKCSRRGKTRRLYLRTTDAGSARPLPWIVSPSPLRLRLCSTQWQDPKVFQEREKRERKKSRLETKKKRKRSFLQFPAAALRQLLLRQQSCKHSLEEEAPPLLLRALPDSPPSSGVHGASGSCCCADMILSKMRRCHCARGRARDVAGWREGWGGGHAHDPGTECSLPRAELELTHHRRHAPLYDSTDGPVI